MQNILYVFPHYDDEIWILGKIHQDIAQNNEVHVCWLTAGKGLFGSQQARIQESDEVMNKVGVSQANRHYIGVKFNIHRVHDQPQVILNELTALCITFQITDVFTPAYEGGHIDHDATNFLVSKVKQKLNISAFEFPLYHRYRTTWGFPMIAKFIPHAHSTNRVALNSVDIQLKKKAIFIHKSQWLILFLVYWGIKKNQLNTKREIYRLLPEHNYQLPPHQNTLYYEWLPNFIMPYSFQDFKKFLQLTSSKNDDF